MIKKITIDNFMAHEHTELELGPGVTMLTGPNNTGKSAVVEALRCVATNPATNPNPALYIRHGAKEARVTVEMEDATKVVWVRTKRWAMYELWRPGADEPEEYHKLQRQVPEDISQVLRLNQVDLETNKSVDIHIGDQRDPIFLLNRPDSDAAAFFAASTESAHLLAMQNRLKRQTIEAKREARAIETQMAETEDQIDKLENLPAIELQMESARILEEKGAALEGELPLLEALIIKQQQLAKEKSAREAASKVLDSVVAPPTINDVGLLSQLQDAITSLGGALGRAEGVGNVLSSLTAPPELEPAAELSALVERIGFVETSLGCIEANKVVLDKLKPSPSLEETSPLSNIIKGIKQLEGGGVRQSDSMKVLDTLASPPELEPEDGLAQVIESIVAMEATCAARVNDLNELEKGLQKVVEALDARIADLGCCPVCGGDLTTTTYLDRGCSHDD